MADLEDIPGLPDLWETTRGDSAVRIALLDGPPDLEHEAFRGARIELAGPHWLTDEPGAEPLVEHSTFITSQLVGQHEGPAPGVAPRCSLFVVPYPDEELIMDWTALTRGVELAMEWGADILHVALCYPSADGRGYGIFTRALERCLEEGMLVAAPVGNQSGKDFCVPAATPGVIAVGALDDDGTPREYSNFGEPYRRWGILANGEDMFGAKPGGGTHRLSGSSCATPIVTGTAGLLVSLQRKLGLPADPLQVRSALLETATPCPPGSDECERYHRGTLNIPAAVRWIRDRAIAGAAAGHAPESPLRVSGGGLVPSAAPRPGDAYALPPHHKRMVFALGELSYDLGSDARRDAFARRMARARPGGEPDRGGPEEPGAVLDHLEREPADSADLVWILTHEGVPVYAIEPVAEFAPTVYDTLRELLAESRSVGGPGAEVERVSVAGWLPGRTVLLRSGEAVPVVVLDTLRGLFGWNTEALVDAALSTLGLGGDAPEADRVRRAVADALDRIYHDLVGLGDTSRSRALNFSATNALQISAAMRAAVAEGLELGDLRVGRSAFCRPRSNCWDIRALFHDPDRPERGRRVVVFSVDVGDLFPVTLGGGSSWWIPPVDRSESAPFLDSGRSV